MVTALYIALTGFFCIASFVIGAKVKQKFDKGETIETPNLNPLKAIRDNRARKEAEKEEENLKKVLRNIDRYDGTSRGQEDVK
jgi:hypothetical protein